MNNINPSDQDFIAGVWNKVHLLKLEQQEQKILIENKRKLIKRALLTTFALIICSLLLCTLVVVLYEFNQTSLLISSFICMIMAIAYENIIDIIGEKIWKLR